MIFQDNDVKRLYSITTIIMYVIVATVLVRGVILVAIYRP